MHTHTLFSALVVCVRDGAHARARGRAHTHTHTHACKISQDWSKGKFFGLNELDTKTIQVVTKGQMYVFTLTLSFSLSLSFSLFLSLSLSLSLSTYTYRCVYVYVYMYIYAATEDLLRELWCFYVSTHTHTHTHSLTHTHTYREPIAQSCGSLYQSEIV